MPENWKDRRASRAVKITREMVDRFAELSGDTSPIHMDDGAARAGGFEGRVAHGFLLGALVSSVLGTQLPGARGVLQQSSLLFLKPCYIGDEVTIEVTCTDYIESVRVLKLQVRVTNARGQVLVKGTVQSGLRPTP